MSWEKEEGESRVSDNEQFTYGAAVMAWTERSGVKWGVAAIIGRRILWKIQRSIRNGRAVLIKPPLRSGEDEPQLRSADALVGLREPLHSIQPLSPLKTWYYQKRKFW